MVQQQVGLILPAEAACGHSTMDMGHDESALILMKHCREMKQQETCLRLVTLLLLLSCAAMFIFTISADLRQQENSGSSGQKTVREQSQACSKQERVCPADNPQINFERLHIHLMSEPAYNKTDGLYINWSALSREKYDKQKRAIVIPEDGFYFVYVRISLSCHDVDGAANFKRFFVALHNWNEGYNKTVPLMEAWDGITCTSDAFRSVFVGQLFDLLKGDHVNVWIGEGYKLITKASFGAYLT